MEIDLETHFVKAEQAIVAKDWPTATRYFEEIRNLKPNQVDVLNNLALWY